MIPSRKSRFFDALFSRHARGRIRRSFSSVRVHGLERVRALSAEAPVLVVSNHTSWWDPLFAIYLCSRELHVDAHAMMDAKNLRRLPFFGLVGAFGVDLDDPADGARAIRYASKLLDRPKRVVWIFAQGSERPITERPLVFRGGTAEIARVARTSRVVPVGLRYELGGDERPVAWISFGPALGYERDVVRGRDAQTAAATAELDRIDDAVCTADARGEFAHLHATRPPAIAAFAERALALLTR